MINVNNLFNYCLDSDETDDKSVYYIDKEKYWNSIINIAFNALNKKIYTKSNEWLYLLNKAYYPNNPYYKNFVNIVEKVYKKWNIHNIDTQYKDFDIVPFVTSFSAGTTHGYSGLYFTINEYLKNKEKLKNHKIIVYKNSQKGILDIIDYLINKKIINNVLYIDNNKLYFFKSIYFIANKWHGFPRIDSIPIIENYILDKPPIKTYNNICVIKSNISSNLTDDGIINQSVINNFCIKNNLITFDPAKMNEIDFANIIHNAKNIIFSWGTTFFKNYVYISDKCKSIKVIVIGQAYIEQYKKEINCNSLLLKYKSAVIKYFIYDYNLNPI